MANFDRNAWESLSLVKRLKAKNDYAWNDIACEINELAPLLGWRPMGLEEYTDHDLNHCYRITLALSNIIPPDFELSEHELEILLYSILFHDLGMWTKKCETEEALQDDNFVSYVKKSHQYEDITRLLYSNTSTEKFLGNLLLRQHVAQYNRLHHAERTHKILSSIPVNTIVSSRISDEYFQLIGTICAAHDWNSDDVLNSDLLDEYRLTAKDYAEEDDNTLTVDVRLIAFLLRIGDLLDLDQRRVSRIVWRYLDKINTESEAHWRKHACLRFQKLNPDDIAVVGDFNYDRYGQVATEAYHLAIEWLGYLKAEISMLQKAIRTPQKYGMKTGRRLGSLYLDYSGVKGTGIIFADNLSFEMNKSRVIEILGDEIYEDKSSFVRELIQNAIDATRTQMVEDFKNGKISNYYGLDLRTPSCWPREVTSRAEYSITISTGNVIKNINNENKNLSYFEVSDRGIGMTISQIKNYFLQIGKSFYKSNDFKTKYTHSSISRFGIGFLSCLLVGTYIEVSTKSREGDTGLKLIMDNSTDFVSIVSEDIPEYGTTVRVCFSPELLDDKGWLPVEQIDEDLMKYSHPNLANSGKLLQAIYYWIPWNEMIIWVNKQKLAPRSPDDLKTNSEFWSFPYRVVTVEDEEILAIGSMLFQKNTLVPRFDDRDEIEDHFLPSIGGITIPPWKKIIEAASYIDIHRQPTSIITASRRAKFEIPSGKVRKEIISQVLHYIDNSFPRNADVASQLHRALFRAAICIDVEDIDLLLPVVRNGQLVWEEWNKRRFSMETCALVPFFIPLEYSNIQFPIPIVGVPRRQEDSPREIIPRIKDVRAININGKFSAALSVSKTWFQGDEIKNKYTYLLYRFTKYNKLSESWEIIQDEVAAQEVIRQEMTDWDRESGNVWKSYGFDPYDDSSWAYALAHYGSIAVAPIEAEDIEVKIPRRMWNLLEKPSEDDPVFKLILRSMRRNEE